MIKLRSENTLLKAEKQFGIENKALVDEKIKIEEDLKKLKSENEKLLAENRVLKENKEIELERVLKVERAKFDVEKDGGLLAESQLMEGSRDIESDLEAERAKFEADCLKCRNQKRDIEQKFELLKTEKLEVENVLWKLKAENEREKTELAKFPFRSLRCRNPCVGTFFKNGAFSLSFSVAAA